MAEDPVEEGAPERPASKKKPATRAPKAKVAPEGTAEKDGGTAAMPEPESEPTYETDSSSESGQASRSPHEQGEATRDAVKDGVASATSWLDGLFPGHGNAALFAILGFVAAILVFSVGFWRTVLIVILVVVGIAIGQKLDGDPKIIRWFSQHIGKND